MPLPLCFKTVRRRALCGALGGMLHGALALAGQPAAAQAVVRVSGTGSGVGGMHLLAKAFMQAHPSVTVKVQPALGSTGGIGALITGHIDVAVSNRPPKDTEVTRLPMAHVEYARTPVVIAVSRDLGVTAVSSQQLAGLFGDGAATFPNGKRARPVLRLADATDTQLLKSFSPEVSQAVDAASKRRGMLNADTDSEAADLIEHTVGAFALSTLALIESEQRPLVALTIDGKAPTMANFAAGNYPHHKTLYLITATAAAAPTRQFADFVMSDAGRALLRAHGHLPR